MKVSTTAALVGKVGINTDALMPLYSMEIGIAIGLQVFKAIEEEGDIKGRVTEKEALGPAAGQ